MRHPRTATAPLALLLLLFVAGPVSAGGMAIVVPTETGGRAVTAGEATTVSFQLLQHGVTPVDFGVTTVVFTDTASGETFQERATPTREAGGFAASFTYPKGGYWTWHVGHDGLIVQSPPVVVGVFEASGDMPAYWPGSYPFAASTAMSGQLDELRVERDRLHAQNEQLKVSLAAASAASVDASAAAEGRPTAAAFVSGVLAAAIVGSLGGVALVLVAGRPRRTARVVREIAVAGGPVEAD